MAFQYLNPETNLVSGEYMPFFDPYAANYQDPQSGALAGSTPDPNNPNANPATPLQGGHSNVNPATGDVDESAALTTPGAGAGSQSFAPATGSAQVTPNGLNVTQPATPATPATPAAAPATPATPAQPAAPAHPAVPGEPAPAHPAVPTHIAHLEAGIAHIQAYINHYKGRTLSEFSQRVISEYKGELAREEAELKREQAQAAHAAAAAPKPAAPAPGQVMYPGGNTSGQIPQGGASAGSTPGRDQPMPTPTPGSAGTQAMPLSTAQLQAIQQAISAFTANPNDLSARQNLHALAQQAATMGPSPSTSSSSLVGLAPSASTTSSPSSSLVTMATK